MKKAAKHAVEDLLQDGGLGGVIALDNLGNGKTFPFLMFIDATDVDCCTVTTPLNCPGMYRGLIRKDGVPKTAIFAEDELEA